MQNLVVVPGQPLKGDICVPGDKSITHRAMILGALARGESQFPRWLYSQDTLASKDCLSSLGIPIEGDHLILKIQGGEWKQPLCPLNTKGSGTTMRLLAGALCGQTFATILDGNEQLRRRPMDRIILPLKLMNAKIEGEKNYAPLKIEPAILQGISYKMPVASAQVKSALLLAGLFAKEALA